MPATMRLQHTCERGGEGHPAPRVPTRNANLTMSFTLGLKILHVVSFLFSENHWESFVFNNPLRAKSAVCWWPPPSPFSGRSGCSCSHAAVPGRAAACGHQCAREDTKPSPRAGARRAAAAGAASCACGTGGPCTAPDPWEGPLLSSRARPQSCPDKAGVPSEAVPTSTRGDGPLGGHP